MASAAWSPHPRECLVLSCEGVEGVSSTSGAVGGGAVVAYDLASGGAAQATLSPCSAPCGGVALLGKDHVIAAQQTGGGGIHLWDWKSENVSLRSFPPEQIVSVAASPSRDSPLIAAGGVSGRIYLWETATGELLRAWAAHYKAVGTLKFTDDGGVLVSGGRDALAQAWSIAACAERTKDATKGQSKDPTPLRVWSGHTLAVTSVWTGHGGAHSLILTSSLDRSVKLWSLTSDACLKSLSFPVALHCVACDPGEYLLFAGGADGRVFEAPLVAGARGGAAVDEHVYASSLEGHTNAVTSISFTLDGAGIVTSSRDGKAVLWDCHSRQAVRTFKPARGPVSGCFVVSKPPRIGAGAGAVSPRITPQPLEKYAGVRRGQLAPWEGAPTKLRRVEVEGGETRAVAATASAETPAADQTETGTGTAKTRGGKTGKSDSDALVKAREETAAAKAEAKRWATLYGELHAATAKDLDK